MSEFNKYSTNGGATFIDVEDSKAVHWGDQSKGYVGKNLLPNFGKSTQSQYGWTVTKNSDNSLSIVANNVTQNSGYGITQHDMVGVNYYLPAGTYIISGGNDDMTGAFNLTFQFNGGANHNLNASNKEETITLTETSLVDCRLWFYAGKSITTTIYPMIRLASIPDSTYEPWYMSNLELTDKLTPIDISSSISLGTMFEGKTSSTSIYAKKSGNMVDVAFLIKPSEAITVGAWGSGIILTGFPNYINNQLFNIPISVNNNIVTYGQMQIRNNVNGLELTAGYTFPADAEIKIQFVYMAS